MNEQAKYSALVDLWMHHNSMQFQWPSIILGAIFVAISIIVDRATIDLLVDTTRWGTDPEIQLSAGIPLLIIGLGTMVMLYTMARARIIMKVLEGEIGKMDTTFKDINHPKGPSGAKLIWRFLAIIALCALILGAAFSIGIRSLLIPLLATIMIPWIALCLYGWR